MNSSAGRGVEFGYSQGCHGLNLSPTTFSTPISMRSCADFFRKLQRSRTARPWRRRAKTPTQLPRSIAGARCGAPPVTCRRSCGPMLLGLEAVAARATEQGCRRCCDQLDKARCTRHGVARKILPQTGRRAAALLEQKNGVSQRMFDALHEELKGYKDGFLLESVHQADHSRSDFALRRPFRRSTGRCAMALTDAGAARHAMAAKCADPRMRHDCGMNIEHNCEFILEVLARLEVTSMPVGTGKLDKRTQRAVAVECAEDPDEDMWSCAVVKRGFLWKERVVRAGGSRDQNSGRKDSSPRSADPRLIDDETLPTDSRKL